MSVECRLGQKVIGPYVKTNVQGEVWTLIYATLRTDMKMIFCSKLRGKVPFKAHSCLSSIILYISFAQVYAPLFHQPSSAKHTFKDKIKNFQTRRACKSQNPKLEPFLAQGPGQLHR